MFDPDRRILGVGYLILRAEGSFDNNTVFALLLDELVTIAEKKLLVFRPGTVTAE
jgi:hypothetical protein